MTSALVVLTTGVMLGLFLRAFPDMFWPATVGSLGFLLLAAILRLASGRDTARTGLSAGLLVVPAGAAFTGGVLFATLLLVEDIFPVETEALLSVGWLTILGHVGVVVGCSVAVFGLVLSRWNVADRDKLDDGMRITVAAGGVPMATTVGFLVLAASSGTTADAAVVGPIAGRIEPVVALVGVVVPDPLVLPALLAVLVLAASLILGRLGRWLAATRLAPSPQAAGAMAGGTVATIAVITVADWAYARTTEELLRRFPAEVEGRVEDTTSTAATSFGESTVVLLAAVLCLGLIAGVLVLVYLALVANTLSGERAGSSLAAVGLFLAAVFGGTVGAPAWLVVVGAGASMLVWDAGRFGSTLAQEVGSGRTRRVELVHLGGTVLVGLVAVVAAVLVIGRLPTDPSAAPAGTDLLALCSVVAGLLSLALALR